MIFDSNAQYWHPQFRVLTDTPTFGGLALDALSSTFKGTVTAMAIGGIGLVGQAASPASWYGRLGGWLGRGMGRTMGMGALAGLGVSLLTSYMQQRRNLETLGVVSAYDRWYRTAAFRLSGPGAGLRSREAYTMRQQMLQVIHNSAYAGRTVLGREAEILHS